MTPQAYGRCARAPVRDTPARSAISGCLLGPLETAALALAEAAPDAESLVVRERVLEALGADVARLADALGVARGSALLREEGLWIGLGAERLALPRQRTAVIVAEPGHRSRDTALDGVDEPVVRCFCAVVRCGHRASPPGEPPGARNLPWVITLV